MKKIIILLPLILLLSCSVQKRKYQKGFYVSNNKHKNYLQKQATSSDEKKLKNEILILKTVSEPFKSSDLKLLASVDPAGKPFFIHLKKQMIRDSLCDLITLKNGDEVSATVFEITQTQIKYKKCGLSESPLYVVKKSDVFMIKYANGTKEVFKSETPTTDQHNQYQNSNPNSTNNRQLKAARKVHPAAVNTLFFGILSIVTAYISLIFLSFTPFSAPLVIVGLALAFIFAIAALIYYKIAMDNIKAFPEKFRGKGMAVTGRVFGFVILSISALILTIIFLTI